MIYDIKNVSDFYKFINNNNYIIIDFYASWCNPCKLLSKPLEELSNKNKNIIFLKINVDDKNLSEIINICNITKLPTIIIFKNNNCIHVFNENILENLNNFLKNN